MKNTILILAGFLLTGLSIHPSESPTEQSVGQWQKVFEVRKHFGDSAKIEEVSYAGDIIMIMVTANPSALVEMLEEQNALSLIEQKSKYEESRSNLLEYSLANSCINGTHLEINLKLRFKENYSSENEEQPTDA